MVRKDSDWHKTARLPTKPCHLLHRRVAPESWLLLQPESQILENQLTLKNQYSNRPAPVNW